MTGIVQCLGAASDAARNAVASVCKSGPGTFETSRRTVMMSVYGVERKSSVRGQIDATEVAQRAVHGPEESDISQMLEVGSTRH